MKKLENLKLSNTFAKLGADFLQEKSPDPVSNPYLFDSNPTAIKLIGLELSEIKKNEFLEYFSGNRLLPNSKPLALAYSGYQFGSYNPRLVDGRGLGSNLNKSDFKNSDLRGANFHDACLTKAQFQNCNLEESDLIWVNLKGAILDNTSLVNAYLQGADLRETNITK